MEMQHKRFGLFCWTLCTIDTVFGSEKGVVMNVMTVAEIKRSGFAGPPGGVERRLE